MRGLLRSIRADRQAGSDHYPDRAETRLLFPVALCPTLAAAPVDGNTRASDWSRRCHPRTASASVSVRRRRKELAKEADCCLDSPVDRDHPRDVYPYGGVRTLESRD